MRTRPRGLLLLLLLAAHAAAPAQDASHLTIEARFVPASAKPGDEVVLEIVCDIDPPYHIYGKKDPVEPTRLTLPAVAGLEAVGEFEMPEGRPHATPLGTNYWVEPSATIKQRFKVRNDAPAGELRLQGEIHYMACTPEFCDPPAKDAFTATLKVVGGAAPGPQKAARAQFGAGGKVTVRPRFEPPVARAGEKVRLVLDVEVERGWHVYGSGDTQDPPTELRDLDAKGLRAVGDPVVPVGEQRGDTFVIEGSFAVAQEFAVPAGTASGELQVTGKLGFQTCDENTCLRPDAVAFTAPLAIEAGPARPGHEARAAAEPGAHPGPTRPQATRPQATQPGAGADGGGNGEATVPLRQPKFTVAGDGDWRRQGLWNLILLCIGGGLIALAMPCTYPMIPITFSFFTKQADARGGRVLPLALAYGAGIVLIFVLVGVLVGEVIIKFAADPVTNLVIGGAFVVFALALFGWINLQPPAFLTRAAGRAGAAGGLLGVFLMGATLVITSFTCTAPIVGALLAGVAQGAGRAQVALGMAAFGLTMAAPFVVLALLPGKVKRLPRSGEWMHTLKVSLGFVELAAALKFVSNADIVLQWGILPREAFLSLWAFVFTLLALFLFGLFHGRAQPVAGVTRKRNAFGVAALAFAFYCLAGASGLRLDYVMTAFEPNYQLRPVEEHTIVTDDHVAAMELARREHKYVLVNFTGFT